MPEPETPKQRRTRTTAYNLRRIRKAKGLSQDKLARLAGFERTQVLRWESPTHWEPSPASAEKLCRVLGVDPRELLEPIPGDEAAA